MSTVRSTFTLDMETAVFDVEAVVELRESYGLRVAQELAEEHRELITEKRHERLG